MNRHCEKTGKRCFSSIKEARRACRNLSDRLRIYLCPYCRFYHYTSHTEGGKRKNER